MEMHHDYHVCHFLSLRPSTPDLISRKWWLGQVIALRGGQRARRSLEIGAGNRQESLTSIQNSANEGIKTRLAAKPRCLERDAMHQIHLSHPLPSFALLMTQTSHPQSPSLQACPARQVHH